MALDAALREFGPAAFDDLLPRLRALALDLDAAHTAGFIHGRLHPNKVFVTDDATYLIGARVPLALDDERQWPVQPPYTAPEVVDGGRPGPTADQYSLAAIAYEWMFGRPIAGPATRSVEVRAIPNVDRAELARAFTRALTPEPFRRFASCADFCDAIVAASAPALPLIAAADEVEEDLEPFIPEDKPPPVEPEIDPVPVSDLSFAVEEASIAPAARDDLDVFDRIDTVPPPAFGTSSNVPPSASSVAPRFGGAALILATLVGAVFGFAAGYMARPRALQSAPSQIATGPSTEAPAPNAPAPKAPTSAPNAPAPKAPISALEAPAPKAQTPAPQAPAPEAPNAAPEAPNAAPQAPAVASPARIGRLLVRSNPSGASVEVDGVARGVTPLALRDLDLGARDITVSRRGFTSEERRVDLTAARPSRSVEVRLTPTASAAAAPRPSTPASLGKPSVSTGSLAIESRPSGASVMVDGKPRGVTPMTLNDLPPGDYQVTLTLQGHQPFATTVRVVAGERARAAARLTEQEQE